MHRGDLRAMAGHPDEPRQSLRARLDQRLERAAGSQSGFLLFLSREVVHLDEVHVIDTQALQRTMETVARALVGAVAGLGGEEEALAMLPHPGADPQFRIA